MALTLTSTLASDSPMADTIESRVLTSFDDGALKFSNRLSGQKEALKVGNRAVSKKEALFWVASSMLMAQGYLWRDNIRMIAAQGTVPVHVFGRDSLPYPMMYWCFENAACLDPFDRGVIPRLPPSVRGVAEPGDELSGDGILVIDQEQCVVMVQMGSLEKQNGECYCVCDHFTLPYGLRFPDDFPAQTREPIRVLLALLSFLNSPFIEKKRERPNRTSRRAAQRENGEENSPDVFVVKLRQPAHATAAKKGGEVDVDWKHQWLVRGHHRAQWYPSTQTHKVIWIAPYVKGPEDAPMLEKVYDVVR